MHIEHLALIDAVGKRQRRAARHQFVERRIGKGCQDVRQRRTRCVISLRSP
jgi:hypothetical protein